LNFAGNVGFQFASRGEARIDAALHEALDQFAKTGDEGGPEKAFERLYQWLQFDKNGKESGLIKDTVREFILNHFPIAAGTDLFGKVVDRQGVHSIHTLAEKTGDPSCPIPDVCIDERRLPLFVARATLRELIAGLEARATWGPAR
jgi:hypothetical protein